MSSDDKNKVDPGCATIVGAAIGAIALIVGTLIGVVLGAKSPTVQVFLGAETPTLVAQPNILGLPLPQPTYTLLPTYTPYPTLMPNATVVSPKPLIVTATPSTDQQDPPPGSTISAGQSYSKNGVTVTLRNPIGIGSDRFSYVFNIDNQSGKQLIVLWKNSFVHARDDTGKVFHQYNENDSDWAKNKQFAIPSGTRHDISSGGVYDWNNDDRVGPFLATFTPATKYVIITIDQLVGMTNMNWRYDLQ